MKVVGNSKLSRKYQATVPNHVRALLQLEAGDLILFVTQGNEIVLKKGELRIKG
jgi:AbrB family looped-hinge helix DNA binding protein